MQFIVTHLQTLFKKYATRQVEGRKFTGVRPLTKMFPDAKKFFLDIVKTFFFLPQEYYFLGIHFF